MLVGDPEQLQAIGAGAAFRSIAERHGGVEIMEVRHQREDWQRDATRALATGRTSEAIRAYDEAGHVYAADTREAARGDLIDRWDSAQREAPDETRMILTHTRDEVAKLNALARDKLRAHHELGIEYKLETSRGEKLFASGDRIMFLANERSLGVKNGSLGIVESVGPTRMAVLMDYGCSVAFDIKDYADIDHGYAATIHKSQGVTVDRTHVLLRQEELKKANEKSHLQRLMAPIDGTVQQLAIHTIGGVVEAVRPIMFVVPYGALIVEAPLLNKGVGFVHQGQNVAIKTGCVSVHALWNDIRTSSERQQGCHRRQETRSSYLILVCDPEGDHMNGPRWEVYSFSKKVHSSILLFFGILSASEANAVKVPEQQQVNSTPPQHFYTIRANENCPKSSSIDLIICRRETEHIYRYDKKKPKVDSDQNENQVKSGISHR